MDIKTYRAPTMREALELVRGDLGPGASVLHARAVNRGLISRWLRGTAVEVAAAVPARTAESTPELASARLAPEIAFADRVRSSIHTIAGAALHESPEAADRRRPARSLADALFECHGMLLDAGFEPRLAREFAERVQRRLRADRSSDASRVPTLTEEIVAEAIATTHAPQWPVASGSLARTQRIVALVGPAGVGKTTTLAKLAANARISEGLRVGLVTVDTYRVAAVEQLGAYAEIMDLPMEVVSTPAEMRGAIGRLAGLDLVLIDTAGRSPRDSARLQELRAMLAEVQPDETHLVLSATTAARGLAEAAERFAGIGITSLLFTKLDEAVTLGQIVGVAHERSLPLSYLTNGQNVPEDILPAEATWLAQRVLGEASR
jgi:flagellar biosynthesis protein FlhF